MLAKATCTDTFDGSDCTGSCCGRTGAWNRGKGRDRKRKPRASFCEMKKPLSFVGDSKIGGTQEPPLERIPTGGKRGLPRRQRPTSQKSPHIFEKNPTRLLLDRRQDRAEMRERRAA
mmetsp:Transcript_24362/g.47833  ORF Transcript_24362/g.47833 Transcript_24362/m.47833 type:complete len:117 (+) Transcript_24362:923-1273(+)